MLPIQFQEHAQLQTLGINAASIGFNTLTLESDRYISVRENVNGSNQVAIIDLHNNNEMMRRPITADSVLMHPSSNIMALKAGRQLQVFNLDTKAKLKAYVMNEDIVLMKWINESSLALVTSNTVYHWSMDGTSNPVQIFGRHQNLANTQIINYSVSKDEKWMVLVGISAQQNRVVGSMQLYNKDRGVSQPIEGHAAAFTELTLEDATAPTKLFAFAVRTVTGEGKLQIIEVDHQQGAPAFTKKAVQVFFPPEMAQDFPVSMQISRKYGIIFLITKMGFLHMYDVESGICIYMNRISNESIFITTEYQATSGLLGINKHGQVLSVSIDQNTIVPFILESLNNTELAIRLASRGGLPGADDLYVTRFNQLFASGAFNEAAKVAAKSPRGILRTQDTVQRFKGLQAAPGQLSPLLQYFGILLEGDGLNKYEALELAGPILQQNRKNLLEKWLKEEKLECSEELGDYVKQHDATLALSVYLRANAPSKVVLCFAELQQYDKILKYAKTVGYTPDYPSLLYNMARTSPDETVAFANALVNDPAGPLVTPEKVVDVFQSQNLVQQATAFLLDYLKPNREQDAQLQTRLLEMNLLYAPQVADAILSTGSLTQYDRVTVGPLCEKAGLYQRALEHFTDIHDIIRVMPHAQASVSADWLVGYFGNLSVDQTLACLDEMLTTNLRQNLQLVVQVAIKYSEQLDPKHLISLFEKFKSNEGLYYYLGSIVNMSQDPQVHFKYIQASCRTGNIREAERICRESNYFEPEAVKNFLKEANLSDKLPLIIVCDRFNFVHDLVLHLYRNNCQSFIEVYVQKVNPSRTPEVIAGLLDIGCDEEVIKNLLHSVTGDFSVGTLCDMVEERNRLKMLQPWLNVRATQGSTDPDVYNALAKIYVDTSNNPEPFLKENEYYDPRSIGKYCEKRDPFLACICYEKGQCDYELLHVTNENSLFKQQARYLIHRRDLNLWAYALQETNDYRQDLIDQVVSTALPECTDPEDVSLTVKAFMNADLPNELIELLEKIILETSAFNDNKTLQNLLIFTAVKADADRVMDYISQLDNFDADDVAQVCIGEDLFEEAFTIFKKYNVNVNAIDVLIDHINDLDRAYEFANKVEEADVWSHLAKAQLGQNQIKEAIDSYIRAKDTTNYLDVSRSAMREANYEDLVRYLQMARQHSREPFIESELLFAYAKTDRLTDLEDMLSGPTVAQVQEIGDRCFQDHLFEAAKLMYQNVSNYASLARTLVYLKDYQGAVDCARKAGNTRVWKEVLQECLFQKEFRLAQMCGLHVIVHAEELDSVVKMYERDGHFEQIMALLENGLGLERAHMGLFTQLAVLYGNYAPTKLMEHLQLYVSRINIPKAIRACQHGHLWRELIFLYVHYDEFDNAAVAMMDHGVAWEHAAFKDIIVKVSNIDLYYKSLRFYLKEHPLLLNDLLASLAPRINHTRVVQYFEKSDNIPLIKSYLLSVQHVNNKHVNGALNELFMEEEDYDSLRDSLDHYDNVDTLDLARRLQKHELLEFRRIASHLYKSKGRFRQSIDLSKEDRLFKDAIQTAAASKDAAVAEELLQYFIEIGQRVCFVAMLYFCYDLLRPDLVLELSWRHRLRDFAMPYFINYIKEQTQKIGYLDEQVQKLKESLFRPEPPQEMSAMPMMNEPMMIGWGSNAGTPTMAAAPPPGYGQWQ
ncbi:clathrin heavy chain [Hesseltinella vesiculosa]|uniref:Clathrin heavy chain n=1 Tax=Hesseltinella vesiculosa TaxID=101127 RepID=A0A1X2GTY8_9FUNG|nr:clathrin heavy chain [Hesseltinella vesiculosa]